MKNIDKQLGKLLFERIEEVLLNEKLSPKERIPKYRTILDDLFKSLTVDATQHINGLSARSIYVFREYDIPRNIINQTHELRKFANKVVHESDLIPDNKDELRCVYQIAQVLSYFSKLEVPRNIHNHYKTQIDEIKKEYRFKKPVLPSYDFHAVVEDVFIPFGDFADKFCVITCNTDELGIIKLKLWNNKNESGFGSDLTVFGKLVEVYQNIFVTKVKPYKEKEGEFYTTDQSYIVLEPDYLIDAKELSECRQFSSKTATKYEDNPLLYILKRFTKGEITDRIMVGNIVGKMLDDVVIEEKYDYKVSFETVMRENSFGMLCMANENGTYDRTNIEKVYIESKDHENQLKEILKTFKDQNLIIEPTFISNKYGLQGRLDLLVDY